MGYQLKWWLTELKKHILKKSLLFFQGLYPHLPHPDEREAYKKKFHETGQIPTSL